MADPRAEAQDKLGGDYEARVLEPSPPAVTDPPFADEPVDPGEVPEGRRLVSPVHNRGDLTWDEIATEEPELADWCAERWLGAWKRLDPLPASFAETRVALHKIAEAVVAPARLPPTEIALRYTRGGFGTPFFEQDGADCQVRVEHGESSASAGTRRPGSRFPAWIRRRPPRSATSTGWPARYSSNCGPTRPTATPRSSSSGRSTSTSRSNSALSRRGSAPTSGPRPATISTMSRISTSALGR